MTEFEVVEKKEAPIKNRSFKERITKIEQYNLVEKVIDYIAEGRSWASIARKLTEYVHNRKNNPNKDFSITGAGIKKWWMNCCKEYSVVVNEKRNAIIAHRHSRYLNRGIKVREKVQKDLENDAKQAAMSSQSAYDYEATARIREKIVKIQESGEKAIAGQSPNLNVTNITINPLNQFTEKMRKKIGELDEEEKNTVDIEYKDVEQTEKSMEEPEEEIEDDDEEDEEDDIEDGDDEEDQESEE